MDFQTIEYLTFDCYGTLIDWETGILRTLRPFLVSKGIAESDDWLLELYGRFEPEEEHGEYKPYREILRRVMHRFATHYKIELRGDEENLLSTGLPEWPPFSDTVESLQQLATRFKLVVLSNIDRDLIEQTARVLGNPFHRIITAQDVRAYKPSHENFRYARKQLGLTRVNHCHVAQSLFHDIAPAKEMDMNTVWIDRRHGKSGGGATPPSLAQADMKFVDLRGFTEHALGGQEIGVYNWQG